MAGGLLLGGCAAQWTTASLGLSWGDRVFDFLPAVCGCRSRIASLHPQIASSLQPQYCYLIFINCAYLFDCFMRKLAAHVARVAYDLGDLRAASLRQMWCEIWSEFDFIKTAHEPNMDHISHHICRKERDRSAIWADENRPN